ncbi:MAG TPA: hypothetical protein VIE69_09050 [Methylophilaceae bacterium]|jgi:hypothetical protein
MKQWLVGLALCLVASVVAYGDELPATKVAFDAHGQLWRASVKQGQVWIDHSQPLMPGDTPKFSTAVAVTTGSQKIRALAIASDEKVWVAWMDENAVIFLTALSDQGVHLSPVGKVAETGYACGGIALQPAPNNQVVALWQQSFDGGARDYAMAKIDMPTLDRQNHVTIHRATFGGLHLDACPQPAPALAKGGDWGWHMAWFDGGDKAGVFYARMDGDAWVSSPAKCFKQMQTAQPSLLAIGEHVWLAWQESNKQGANINVAMSDDGGRSWASPIVVAQTQGVADDPILFNQGEQAYLSWNTAAGLRLLALPY